MSDVLTQSAAGGDPSDPTDPGGAMARGVPPGSPLDGDRKGWETVKVLVADDERTIRESLAGLLESEGFSVMSTGKGSEAADLIRRKKPDVLLLDLFMAEVSGMSLLEEAIEVRPDCLVVMMTGKPSVDSSIQALTAGAWNYLPKPFSATHIKILMGRAARAVLSQRESLRLREQGHPEGEEEGIDLLGQSEVFRRVIERARQVAPTDASVFIHGESGTGKELVARFIHKNSRRNRGQLVTLNSAAIPESLLESEMFGHVEGAFTGAVRHKEGLLESANGGTLFLDELADMSLPVQAKLLRVIQDGSLRRVGSTKVDAVVNVRFIAATNRHPAEAMRKGDLREDLYYRLRVFPIRIPPLRERPSDIPLLARHFLSHFWSRYQGLDVPEPVLTDEAIETLRRHPWRGNVRELKNVMEHAVVVLPAGTRVQPEHIPFLEDDQSDDEDHSLLRAVFPLHEEYHTARDQVLAEFELSYLRHVMIQTHGKLSEAADLAGVDRTTLYRLMERHGVSKDELVPRSRRRDSDG